MRISDWSSDVCSSDLAAVEYQHGLRVSHLLLDIALRPIGIERQPRRNGAESRKGMGVPWHGRTNRIAAQSQPRLAQFPWVLNLIVRDGHVGKADFLTIIDGWRTTQSEQQHGRSKERREGKECVRPCRSQWSPSNKKKKYQTPYK